MKVKDCIKGFTQGISKVIPPSQTCKTVLTKFRRMNPSILKGCFEVARPSGVPQYRVIGSDYYQQIIKIPSNGANGKGHSKEQALASGLMELVERYSCFKYILDSRNVCGLYSFKELNKKNLFQLKDLCTNLIDKAQAETLKEALLRTAKIRWLVGYSLRGKKVSLPIDLIMRLVEGSNGMAAGNSLEEALLHGICEVVERHCSSLIEQNKLKTPIINLSTVNIPIARKLIKMFQSLKQPIFVKDFSLGIGLPVIGVVRKIDKFSCIVTTGVATTREEALVRALTENSQTESKKYSQKICLVKHYFENDTTISLKDVSNIDNINMRLELENIENILNKHNMKIFFVNTTDKYLNIPSVFVYISGAMTIYYDAKITNQRIIKLLIEICLDTENYGDLEKYLKKAIKNNYIDQFEYSYYRGIIFKRRSQYQEAIRYLSQAAKTEVNESRGTIKNKQLLFSFVNLGLCYQALNDKDAAIVYYSKAIDLSPDFRIENLRWYYDNIRLLAKDRDLFNDAINLFGKIRLLRMPLSKLPQ